MIHVVPRAPTPATFRAAHDTWCRAQKRAIARARRLGLPYAAYKISNYSLRDEVQRGIYEWGLIAKYFARGVEDFRERAASPMNTYWLPGIPATPVQRHSIARRAHFVYTLAADALFKLYSAALAEITVKLAATANTNDAAPSSIVQLPGYLRREQRRLAAAA